jgi:hypothetical protein
VQKARSRMIGIGTPRNIRRMERMVGLGLQFRIVDIET